MRIDGGVIQEILPGWHPPRPGDQVLDHRQDVLVPGLVMAHTHVDYGWTRGMAADADFFPWIRALTQLEKPGLEPDQALGSAQLSCLELVRHGVVGVGENTDFGVGAVEALGESGLRAWVFQEEFGPHPDQAQDALGRLETKLDRLEEIAAAFPRVSIGISPHAPYTLSPSLIEGMVELGRARGMPLSIHLAETRDEVDFVRAGQGPFADFHRSRAIPVRGRQKSPFGWFLEEGWLESSAFVLLIHGVFLDPEDLVQLGGLDRVHLVHCPTSNARLGTGIAPIRAALDAGVSVLLGLDGASSADRLDPFAELQRALLFARAREERAGGLTCREALGLATAASEALGFSRGQICPGEPADLVVLETKAAALTPFRFGLDSAVLAASGRDVVCTMVEGEVLYRRGEFFRVDAEKILAAARAYAPEASGLASTT